jgi:hypothetical protein
VEEDSMEVAVLTSTPSWPGGEFVRGPNRCREFSEVFVAHQVYVKSMRDNDQASYYFPSSC